MKRKLLAKFGCHDDSLKHCELCNEFENICRIFNIFVKYNLFPNEDKHFYLRKLLFYYGQKPSSSKLDRLLIDHMNLLLKYGKLSLPIELPDVRVSESKLSSNYKQAIHDLKQILNQSHQQHHQPRSLKILCRNRLRNLLVSLSDKSISRLDIPSNLKSILF